ncbi:hypothetical protein Cgig2_030091 [Carnegiea gigantea]|uniref:Uncharacterized protein n=1 Tax=Carnegiea gigantea TaxID=171969 RepID=A0A9Q1GWE1_9CARY|nr:hypothetical protein Cgig2_030091 [Carnegiea gigantea]
MRLPVILFFVLISLLTAQLPPDAGDDAAFTSLLISTQGLHFIKDLLISKALSSLIPLRIPQIQQSHNIPLLGNVVVLLSNITINQINVSESYITPGDSGINIVVSGATANLSLDWSYSYSYGWFIPYQISDRGTASVKQRDSTKMPQSAAEGVKFSSSNASCANCGGDDCEEWNLEY